MCCKNITHVRKNYTIENGLKIRGYTLKCGAGFGYNSYMKNVINWQDIDRARLLAKCNRYADAYWHTLTCKHSGLARHTRPDIRLNAKFLTMAGRCYEDLSFIDLGLKFFPKFHVIMFNEILAHEICHAADFALFNTKCTAKISHGKNWQTLMLQLGVIPNQYHDMTL